MAQGLKPCFVFGTTPQFWLNLQTAYDLRMAESRAGEAIAKLPRRSDAATALQARPV